MQNDWVDRIESGKSGCSSGGAREVTGSYVITALDDRSAVEAAAGLRSANNDPEINQRSIPQQNRRRDLAEQNRTNQVRKKKNEHVSVSSQTSLGEISQPG
jgi:hypothetical protein